MARQEMRVQEVAGTSSTVGVSPAAGTTDAVMFVQLKAQLTDKLEQLSSELMRDMERRLSAAGRARGRNGAEAERLQQRIRLFGQFASGLVDVVPEVLPAEGAGFGSTVTVEDLDHGTRETYTLVTGNVIDVDAGQVSLASPIGQSLLGRRAGETIVIETPQRLRRLRVVDVRTLHDRLNTDVSYQRDENVAEAVGGGETC